MKKRVLGNMEVSAVGLGCMGFSTGYGAIPEESESIRLIRLAFEKGCTLFDTAEQYAAMRNEELPRFLSHGLCIILLSYQSPV